MTLSPRGLWRGFRAWTLQERTDALWLRLGIGAWTALIIGVCVFSILKPGKKSVSTVYWKACWDWWSQVDMYIPYDRAGLHGYL